MKSNKIISLIVLICVLAATVVGAYLGFAGRNTQMVTVTENGVDTQRALYRQVAFIPNTFNKNWQEAIVPSALLGGGIEYTFVATQGDMTDAEFAKAVKTASKVLADRAEMIGGDASVSVEGSNIFVTVPAYEYDSLVASVLSPVGDFTLAQYDANTGAFLAPVLTADHIKTAGYYVDSTGTSYSLQLQLNKKGQKALAEFAKNNAGNTLYLLQDGSYLSALTITSGMDTEYLSLSMDDWTYALVAAICIRSGSLPLSVGLTDYVAVEGRLAWLLDAVVMGMLVVTVLAMLFVILRGKTVGVVNALTIAAQGVVFCLVMALTAISASWKMNISALVLLTACQALFLCGMVLVNEKIAAQCKHRGLKQAAARGFKGIAKPLCIVYGALVVLGVVLMLAFVSSPAAILGRIVAISGVVSFAMIFVAQRILLSCVAALKVSK